MGLIFSGFEKPPASAKGGAVTIGNFDGVHRGHRELVGQLKQVADSVGGPAVVVTFDPPPAQILRPEGAPPALTWMERRTTLLCKLGIDAICICPTSPALLELEPEAFFERVLLGALAARGIVEGPNFRFGRERRGDTDLLRSLCQRHRMELAIVEGQSEQGDLISSSRIRRMIREGNIREANELLLEPYRITGQVTHGAARGKQLGFPTANLESIPVLVPPFGVYAGRSWVGGKTYPAAIHIGPNLTFGESACKVEVHLIGLDQDLYGQQLEVEILDHLRGIRRFASAEELLSQLRCDIRQTEEIATR